MNIKNSIDKVTVIFLLLFVSFTLIGCGDKASLSEGIAINSVETYLASNPIYETVDMEIGDVKFRVIKDINKLQAYKELAAKGYIDFKLVKQKKKFLSKDSVYEYEVKLLDKARPFILKQKKETVEVKSFEYQLEEKEQSKIELSSKKTGNVVLTLKKVNTDFSVLAEDKNPNASFITKTFTLNYKKDKGWIVTKYK